MRFALASLLLLAACTPPLSAPVGTPSQEPSAPPSPACVIRADLELPPSEGDVEVVVFNGSDLAGLGRKAGEDLKARGFRVTKVTADPARPDTVALLRFGPTMVGSAALVNAHFGGAATLQFDARRRERTVDVVVGSSYRQLAATPEKSRPQPPPGTCARDRS